VIRGVAWRLMRTAVAAVRHPLGVAFRTIDQGEHWSREALATHRDQAFRALMVHCHANVPYYRALMDERRLSPADFRTASDLAKLPFLTKDLIRARHSDLQARNIPDDRCLLRRSGGTTGEPIAVRVDAICRAFETACFFRGLNWAGWSFGSPLVQLTGGSLGLPSQRTLRVRARLWLMNQVFLAAGELGADNVRQYVRAIEANPGGILVGYASAVVAFARYMEEAGLKGGVPLRAAVCTADQLHDDWRATIGRVLGVPVFSYYGCNEIHSLGYERRPGESYFVPQEHVVIEAAGTSSDAFQEQGSGPLACTSLYNYAMPLLRYMVGDSGELGPATGREPYQRIVRLDGRVFDYLEAEDGDRITGAFASHLVLVSRAPVWKWQVVQYGHRRIEFRYLTEDGSPLSDQVRQTIRIAMQKHLGARMAVDFVVGGFETSQSAKHRIIVRKEDG